MTRNPVSSSTCLPFSACNLNGPTESIPLLQIVHARTIGKVQIYVCETKTVLVFKILFTLFTLHFVTKRVCTTETDEVTWQEQDVNIACDWLNTTPHRPHQPSYTVSDRLDIGLTQVKPGMKKSAKFLTGY